MSRMKRTDLPTALRKISRKREVAIEVVPEGGVRTFGTWWDGGSRATYDLVCIRTGGHAACQCPTSPFGPVSSVTLYPAPGHVIVEGGTFCGKPATPRLYVRPEERLAFLSIPVPDGAPIDAPAPILADWLRDHNRDADAARLLAVFPR